MIPGLSSTAEARLAALLDERVSDASEAHFATCSFTILSGRDAEAQALGVQVTGGEVTVVVTDPERPLGRVVVQSAAADNVLFFDNRDWTGGFRLSVRMLGSDTVGFFCDIGDRYVAIDELFLRSHSQTLFWGIGASAVGLSVEMEGEGRSTVIGDDALISGGVWVRNHDMHAMHDLRSGSMLSRPPCDTVVERHVWLGQDALLLGAERVGMGSIIGARTLAKGTIPPRMAVAGTPARVIREGVSWGRLSSGMTAAERAVIGMPPLAD
jgi:carbonic anhydrase/acetyltransferase-like protein (isoleucine patch superfamily)